MYRISAFLLTWLLATLSMAQEPNWRKLWALSSDSTTIWDADETGNLYVVQGNDISKFGQDGKLVVSQSIRSMGSIQKVDAENSLKPTLFSEDQQQVCFLDNVLALQNCIDLSDQEIQLASQFSSSVQTDRFWIYDQSNSQLILITARNAQQQRIQNLKGITAFDEPLSLEEYNNQLYIIDRTQKLLVLDNFGNLLHTWELPKNQDAHPLGEGILLAIENQLFAYAPMSQELLPFFTQHQQQILSFHFSGNRLFVQDPVGISCYELRD